MSMQGKGNTLIIGISLLMALFLAMFILNKWITREIERPENTVTAIPASVPAPPVVDTGGSTAVVPDDRSSVEEITAPAGDGTTSTAPQEIIYEIPQKDVILIQ